MYSIFSSTPNLGKAVTMILTGFVVGAAGWQWGFLAAAVAGIIGLVISLTMITDTPESAGLPSVQEYYGEAPAPADSKPTREIQKWVIRHPGIWVIALSSAFIYITQHAVSDWGVLLLQKQKGFSLESATQIIGISEVFGVVGTLLAGWLSDSVFRGNRVTPVIISGILSVAALLGFLFLGGGFWTNILFVAVFALCFSVVFCVVAGLMALDFVPRKATGSAMGIVGISSYVAAGAQSILSGFLIEAGSTGGVYDFTPVAVFWTCSCLLAFVLPVILWRHLKK